MRFQARGQVHRLAPDVVGKLVGADHPGHDGAARDADADAQVDALRLRQLGHDAGQRQRQPGEAAAMVVLRAADSGHGHIAVADGLDLLHAMERREPVEFRDEAVEDLHRARRAERLRQRSEADEIGEHHGGIGHGVGDARPRRCLQAVDDRYGENILEQPVGLGAGAVRLGQRVADHQRDDAERGHGGGDVEVIQQCRIGFDAGVAGRVEEPGREMQRKAGDHGGDHEPDVPHAADGEGNGRADDVVELDAGVVAQLPDEQEQGRVFGDPDHDHGCDVADAVGQRREQRDDRKADIHGDQRPIVHDTEGGVGRHIGHRRCRDQQRHRINDREPDAGLARIGADPEFDETAQRPEARQKRPFRAVARDVLRAFRDGAGRHGKHSIAFGAFAGRR